MQSALDPKHLPVMSSSPVNLEPTMSPISSTLTTEQKGQPDLHSSGCSTGLVLGLLYIKMATGKIRVDMGLINPHPQAKTRARNPLRA